MAKGADRSTAKRMPGGRQEKNNNNEELYFRHVDHVERWRREAEHYQAVENKLEEMSYFSYEEVDYAPLMVRSVFAERVVPDYSYMLKDEQIAAESKFFVPICIRVILLIVLLFILIVGTNSVLLWMSGAGVLTLLILILLMIQERHSFIERALLAKQAEIEKRVADEQQAIADEKKQHEDNEDERIKMLEDLFTGEISTIFAEIENVLNKLNVFFDMGVQIDLYNNIPSIKVWLPPKSIIPITICVLQTSGRPSLVEKEISVINKQYLELCAGILMKVMSAIYSHIPIFTTGYIYGMSKEGENVQCLIGSKVERETLILACGAASGLEGIQKLKADFQCNTLLALLPIEVDGPEEWNGIEPKLIRRLQVNLVKA